MRHCNNCGAPLRLDHGRLLCDHCGSHEELPAALEYLDVLEKTSWACPLCSTPLSDCRLEGLPLLCCANCFGMLIQMECFAAVIDAVCAHEPSTLRSPLPRRQSPGERTVPCPMCGQRMTGHQYGGPGNVVIDSCERCGVNWLDPGELRRIAMAPDSRHGGFEL